MGRLDTKQTASSAGLKPALPARSRFWPGFRSVPVALLAACLLAYALQLPRLGFYWDDWPWIWTLHVEGPAGLLGIDAGYRPLAGEILWLGALLAGKSPLGWQIFNLVLRWLSGLAFWWSLRKLWPGAGDRLAWVALLFLVYPGFRQQFVAVNSSRHILPLALYFLSVGLMAWAVQDRARRLPLTAAALACTAVSMLATEYYYGLELLKPVLLWLVLGPHAANPRQRLGLTLKYWLPYLALLGGVFVWRYLIAPQGNYPISITGDLARQPAAGLLAALQKVAHDFITTGFSAWGRVFVLPRREDYGLMVVAAYWSLAASAALLAWLYLRRLEAGPDGRAFARQALGLGALALLVGGLPFLVTGIWVGLDFPSDRTTLSMLFGASLLFAGLIELLGRKRSLKILLVSLAVGLAIGMHFLNAADYARDWEAQATFFRQLAARLPGLRPGTALVYEYTTALQDLHVTDNSFTGPLNWMYAPNMTGRQLPYQIYDLRLRTSKTLPPLEPGRTFQDPYGAYTFSGATDSLLAVQFAPPGCLQVLRPEYAGVYPHLPDQLAAAVRLSNLEQVELAPADPAGPLPEIFKAAGVDWCTLYEQADLAAQLGDWQQVARLGDQALVGRDGPRQPAERLPFIHGYAHTGRWDRAEAITLEMVAEDRATRPLACRVWAGLAVSTPASPEKAAAAGRVRQALGGCPE